MCPLAKGFGSAVSRDRWEEPGERRSRREGGREALGCPEYSLSSLKREEPARYRTKGNPYWSAPGPTSARAASTRT